MSHMDPHLTILLDDFIRLCPGDAPLEEEDWTGLYEICLFLHEQDISCTASSLREFLLEQGCSPRKATLIAHQVGHFLHILILRDHVTRPRPGRVQREATGRARRPCEAGGRGPGCAQTRHPCTLPVEAFPGATIVSHRGHRGDYLLTVCSPILEHIRLLYNTKPVLNEAWPTVDELPGLVNQLQLARIPRECREYRLDLPDQLS